MAVPDQYNYAPSIVRAPNILGPACEPAEVGSGLQITAERAGSDITQEHIFPALRPLFIPTVLADSRQGGVWANDPVMVAVADALSCFDLARVRIHVLSLGCGTIPCSPQGARQFALHVHRLSQ